MQIATILPIKYLELEEDSKYHLCLAHLMHNPTYIKFFFLYMAKYMPNIYKPYYVVFTVSVNRYS